MTETCRCGWDGEGDHPCHGKLYSCKKPAERRFYAPSMRFALAGARLKFSTRETFACAECWEWFQKELQKHYDKEGSSDGHQSP